MTAADTSAAQDQSTIFTGWASTGTSDLKQYTYHPRPLGPKDVEVKISHCGICGTDLHTMKSEWGPLVHGPCITGHEIAGVVTAAAPEASHAIGARVAVGAQVHACGECENCKSGYEQICSNDKVFTYNAVYKDGGIAQGGYADRIRVHSDFVFPIPEAISSAEAAPLMCAGVTTYSPLKAHGAGPDKVVGIIGIGGLGHLAIQWASAFKSKQVVAISTSDSKREEAIKLGATRFVNSRNPQDLEAAAKSMDLIICTSFEKDQDWTLLLTLVKDNGKLVLLSPPETPISFHATALIIRQVSVVGSLIGGRAITQEMLEFAAEHNVRPWIEKFPMAKANEAVKHLENGRPRYRIVLEN